MNRREFLKAMLAVPAAGLAVPALEPEPYFLTTQITVRWNRDPGLIGTWVVDDDRATVSEWTFTKK